MPATASSFREIDARGAAGAIAGISAIGIAIGLSFPLMSILLDQRGHSGAVIGANTAMAGVASMAAIWLVNPIADRLGVTGGLILAALVAALTLPLFYLFDNIAVWFVLRTLFSGALSVSFVLSEFWINSAASEKRRGFILGVYATVLSLGFGIGPGILAVTGSEGALPFVIGSAILAASTVPVWFARLSEPSIADHAKAGASAFLRYVFLVPLATGAVFVFGAVEQSGLGLMPVYGTRNGYGEQEIAYLLMVLAAGNVIFQIPIGMASDRMGSRFGDRRPVLYACALIGAAGAAALPFSVANPWLLGAVLFIWGGVISGMYTVGLAHLGSRLSGRDLAEANSAFALCYTIGMIIGPQLAGLAIDAHDPHGFAWSMFAWFVLYLAMAAVRAVTRRGSRP